MEIASLNDLSKQQPASQQQISASWLDEDYILSMDGALAVGGQGATGQPHLE